MPAITEVSFKKSDANAVNTNIIDQEVQYQRKICQTKIQSEPPTLLKKSKLLHPAHIQNHREKSPTRVPSNTKQASTNRDKEIEKQRFQINFFK